MHAWYFITQTIQKTCTQGLTFSKWILLLVYASGEYSDWFNVSALIYRVKMSAFYSHYSLVPRILTSCLPKVSWSPICLWTNLENCWHGLCCEGCFMDYCAVWHAQSAWQFLDFSIGKSDAEVTYYLVGRMLSKSLRLIIFFKRISGIPTGVGGWWVVPLAAGIHGEPGKR